MVSEYFKKTAVKAVVALATNGQIFHAVLAYIWQKEFGFVKSMMQLFLTVSE